MPSTAAGDSALHLAVAWPAYRTDDVASFLLRNGANPNLPDAAGLTPMDHLLDAMENGGAVDESLLRLAITRGGEVRWRDAEGKPRFNPHQYNYDLLNSALRAAGRPPVPRPAPPAAP